MTIQRAALWAAIGVLLRALHYWVANMIPSWNSSGVMDQVSLALVSVVDPLVWSLYFGTIWREWPNRIAALLAALLGLVELGFSGYRQWESLSWTSLDTIALLFGAVLPVVFWTLYLVFRWRFGLWYLLLFSLSQVSLFVYQMVSGWPQMQEFWREEPWQLLVAPLIWIFYWATQTLFVQAAQRQA